MAQQNRRYDRTRFISFEADAWEKEAVTRHLIEERGLDLTEADGEHILPVLALIEPFGWTKLVRNPGQVVLMLVREFYANMNVRTNTSIVRGQKIFFGPEFINMLYETPDLEDAPLQAIIRDPNMSEIGPALCPLGIEWHVDTYGQRDWFPTRNLSTPAKVWMLFLSSRLEPNKNTYEIRPRRAAWLYAIMQRYSINIGRVICEIMKRCRTKKSEKSLHFGSTITELIKMFGNSPTPDFGFTPTHNIGIAAVRALGPCVGQIGAPGRRQQGRGEFAAYFDRLEETIDRLYTHQQQFREELTMVRAVQRDHLFCTATILYSCGYDINNVINALNLANIPTIPPFTFQNMNFNFPAGHENVQPPPLGYQVFNGEVAGEIAPLPGAHGEYAVAPKFVDPGFAGGVDLEMAFEQLVEVTEEAGPSGEMADFQDHTNIFGENGSSSSSNTNKE